jgi:hypothetical protein
MQGVSIRLGYSEAATRESAEYKLHLFTVGYVWWDKHGTEPAHDFTLSVELGVGIIR